MVENENDKPVDWVKARAECSLKAIFDNILFRQIEEDVAKANKLLPMMGRHFVFEAARSHLGDYPVIEITRRYEESKTFLEIVRVVFDSKRIVIHPCQGDTFEVATKWNDEDITCDICIGDKPYKIWQISRKALSGLFFE